MDAEACSAPSNSTDRDRCFIGMIPIEIITELLTNLDFRDIFRVRKTCKLLRRAANMPKPYWVNLLYQHAWSGHPPLPLPIPIPFPLPLSLKLKLERPLDLYSAEELERVALQWITADMGWPNPVRQRTIVSTPRLGEGAAAPSAVLQHHLVEGGRWLIVVTDTGTVSYFDLEHEDGTRGRVLVHGQIPSGRGVRICMDVDVDAEEPVLTFNIGLDITERPGPEEPPTTSTATIQIIRVVLELDIDNRGIGLSATVLAAFPRETSAGGEVRSVSLIGRVIAYLVNLPDLFRAYVVVVNWVKAFAHVQLELEKGRELQRLSYYMKRVIYLDDHQEFVRLVPGNKVVVTGRRWSGVRLRMYDILDVPITRKLPTTAEETTENTGHTTSSTSTEEERTATPCIWTALFQTGKECPRTHFLSKPYRFHIPAPEAGDTAGAITRLMVRAQTGLHVVDIRDVTTDTAATATPEGAGGRGSAPTRNRNKNNNNNNNNNNNLQAIPQVMNLIDGFMQKNGKVTPRRPTRIVAEFFGIRRGIVVFEDDSAVVLRYHSAPPIRWDVQIEAEAPPSAPETICFALPASRRFTKVCVDERSGRVVLLDASGHEMVVIDFALMYQSQGVSR